MTHMSTPLRTHPFHHSGYYDWRGRGICDCGSTRDSSVHRLPQRGDDEKALDARRIGEGGDG